MSASVEIVEGEKKMTTPEQEAPATEAAIPAPAEPAQAAQGDPLQPPRLDQTRIDGQQLPQAIDRLSGIAHG